MFMTIVLMVLMLMLRLMMVVLLALMVVLMPILVDPGTLWDNVDRSGQTWPVRYLAGRTRDL